MNLKNKKAEVSITMMIFIFLGLLTAYVVSTGSADSLGKGFGSADDMSCNKVDYEGPYNIQKAAKKCPCDKEDLDKYYTVKESVYMLPTSTSKGNDGSARKIFEETFLKDFEEIDSKTPKKPFKISETNVNEMIKYIEKNYAEQREKEDDPLVSSITFNSELNTHLKLEGDIFIEEGPGRKILKPTLDMLCPSLVEAKKTHLCQADIFKKDWFVEDSKSGFLTCKTSDSDCRQIYAETCNT